MRTIFAEYCCRSRRQLGGRAYCLSPTLMVIVFAVATMVSTLPQSGGGASVGNSYTLTIPRGLSMIANHLDHGGNTLAELLPDVPEGTLLYKFDNVRKAYTVNQFQFGAWLRPDETLAPGEGAWVDNPGNDFSVTFTGTKPSSSEFPKLYGGWNLISLPVPSETLFPVPYPGDRVLQIDPDCGCWISNVFDWLDNAWWGDDLDDVWLPGRDPQIKFGRSFFYFDASKPVAPDEVSLDGQVTFATYFPPVIDARWTYWNGLRLGAGWTAQLFGGPAGTPPQDLEPLFPTTTFQTTRAGGGYVYPVMVSLPNVPLGAEATIVMRIYDGETYESSIRISESNPITISTGGWTLPPAELVGLQPVTFLGAVAPIDREHSDDFNHDGWPDLLLQDSSGQLGAWFMRGTQLESATLLDPPSVGSQWRVVGTGYFYSATFPDVAFQHTDGTLAVWLMNGVKMFEAWLLNPNPGSEWRAVGVFGDSSLLFQHTDGTLAAGIITGVSSYRAVFFEPWHPGDPSWQLVGSGDFDGDFNEDLVFQSNDGSIGIWFLNGLKMVRATLTSPANAGDNGAWRVAGIMHLNADGKPDLLLQNSRTGRIGVWFMNGSQMTEAKLFEPSLPGGTWKLVAPR